MRIERIPISLSIVALVAAGGHALAQAPLPSLAGEVEQWTLTGRGDVDGLLLIDVRQIGANRAQLIAVRPAPGVGPLPPPPGGLSRRPPPPGA